MLKGIVIFTFNEKRGMHIETKFPIEFDLDPSILMRIYTAHAYDKSVKFFSLSVGSLNIASTYTGSEMDLYISLILDTEDDPDDYEDILDYAGIQLLNKLSKERYLDLIPSIFSRIVYLYKKKKQDKD
ncbi:MAG: hypothetical protein EAX96_10490 [Candidatus Lokiarchaeota archaeon]|nr:hypothetical protein [Candidatus Lokiarchaeota archaeon]